MSLHDHSQKMDHLKKVPLFSSLSKDDLAGIAKLADETEMEEGMVLARQNKLGGEFCLIVDGKARVEQDGKIIRHLSAGDYFGEISLIDGKLRTASVIAETDGILLVVERRAFSTLLDSVQGLQKKILISLCSYIRRYEDEVHS